MASHLLRREDRLFNSRKRADLAQLGKLHVLQALGVLGQAHMAHAPLDVVDEPALAVNRHDGDLVAGNVAAILQHLAARHDIFAHLAALYPALANLDGPDSLQHGLQFRIVLEILFGIALFLPVDGLENADDLGRLFDPVDLGHIDDIWRCPVKGPLLDAFGPGGRIVAPCVTIGIGRHGGQNVAQPRVGLVLALGVQIEEHGAVSVIDRLNADALLFVLFVVFVLVDGTQAERAKATADSLLEGVVIGFVRAAVLLVGPEQPVAGVGQLVVVGAVLADEINRDPVVAVFVDDPHDGEVDLVHLELGLVQVLLIEVALPLRARDGIKAAILQALQTLIAHHALDGVELGQCFCMDVCKPLFFGHAGQGARLSLDIWAAVYDRPVRISITVPSASERGSVWPSACPVCQPGVRPRRHSAERR